MEHYTIQEKYMMITNLDRIDFYFAYFEDKIMKYEFGGPQGVTWIILGSHGVMFYLLWCLEGGNTNTDNISHSWVPNMFTITTYLIFILFEAVLATLLPGVETKGLSLSKDNKDNKDKTFRLNYLCNGLCSWYVTLGTVLGLHYLDLFRISWIVEDLGKFMVTAILFADILSVLIYVWGKIVQENIRMSGNPIYDFFMGSILNPRIGTLDLKMFAEIRISWILLFLLTLSSAVKQYEELGYITTSMILILLAQGLYTNACMKGEECIPTTWDIFYEKFGWMLIFWNFAGVPFLYTLQSYYIYTYNIEISTVTFVLLCIVLLGSYYVWDTANSQKNRFRMQQRGTYIERKWAFPQLPWGTLKDPKYLTTKAGSCLLVDGWWGKARKIHYTADLTMALVWGLSCGFGSFIPYFYFFFFLAHLVHRVTRDMERCAKKYGDDWVRYCKQVPWIFVPYIY